MRRWWSGFRISGLVGTTASNGTFLLWDADVEC